YQMANQRFANPGPGATGRYGQAPEAGTVLRVIEGLVMIDAHHAADDLAGILVFSHPVNRPAFLVGRAALRIDRQHAARLVQAVDRAPVRLALRTSYAKAAEHSPGGAVIGEPQA